MIRFTRQLPLLGLVACLASSSLQAATISHSDTFGPGPVAEPTIVVPLAKFDPSLGTLLKVILTLDAETSAGSIVWDNEAGLASDIDLGRKVVRMEIDIHQ